MSNHPGYPADGRALRIETDVNDPATWAANAACTTFPRCRPKPVREPSPARY